LTTIRTIERELVLKNSDFFDSNIRFGDESGSDFLFAKELANRDPSKKFSGNSFCFFHDLGEHSGRYREVFVQFLNLFSEPTRILLVDFRGHGKSSGTRGHVESLDDLCIDSVMFLNSWNKDSECPVTILSVGLGSIVSLKVLHLFFSRLEFKVSGLVLLNPGLKWKWKVPSVLEAFVDSISENFKKVKLPFLIDGALFADDSVAAQEFDADPLINHTMTWGTFLEVQRSASVTRTSAYYLDVPVFIGVSGRDKLYDHGVTELFTRGIFDCSLVHYEEAFHDLLNYFENEKVIKDVYNWVTAKTVVKNNLGEKNNE
jgi:alpha-beta hydrolase superfamily lysophospholipase